MPASLVQGDSLLAVDVGGANTRAVLFDVVEGEYRFLASGSAPSTAEAPFKDVSEGARNAIASLQTTTGRVLLEIYNHPKVAPPDYRKADPLVIHLAFCVDDVRGERDRLVRAGAAVVDDFAVTPSGDEMAMLRDPWGFPIQLVHRAKPM